MSTTGIARHATDLKGERPTPELSKAVRAIVMRMKGYKPAAKALGSTPDTLDEIITGGWVRAHVLRRIEMAIRECEKST